MIATSRTVKLLALGCACAAHAAVALALLDEDPVLIEGGGEVQEARLGASFADLASGTLAPDKAEDTTDPVPPVPAEPSALQEAARPSPEAAEPERRLQAPEAPPDATPRPDPQPAAPARPDRAETPAEPEAERADLLTALAPDLLDVALPVRPTPEAAPASPESAAPAAPPEIVTATDRETGPVTRSPRPPPRRKAEAQPTPPPPSQRGNAEQDATAGAATGRATATAAPQGADARAADPGNAAVRTIRASSRASSPASASRRCASAAPPASPSPSPRRADSPRFPSHSPRARSRSTRRRSTSSAVPPRSPPHRRARGATSPSTSSSADGGFRLQPAPRDTAERRLPLTETLTSAASFAGGVPDSFVERCVEHVRAYDLPLEVTTRGMSADYPQGRIELERDAAGFTVRVTAGNEVRLYQMRESVLYLLDRVFPGTAAGLDWSGDVARDTAPPNFHLASVRSVRRVSPNFLRVEVACDGTRAMSSGGMHFSLLLPPRGRAPRWPRIDGTGRTVWPDGADTLHRAAYTFVDLSPEGGWFSFDVFEHRGGRTTDWARKATAGETVGVMGPGGGDFPPGDNLLIAGDETALPAIRRILERSSPARHGAALIEVADDEDRCPIASPAGLPVTWLNRERGEHLEDHLRDVVPPGPDQDWYVWVASEQSVVRRCRTLFRENLKIERTRSYFSTYWMRRSPPT